MNKPTLILIPGLLCDHAVWQYQIKELQQHANVIIPKTSGFKQADDIIEHIIEQSPNQFLLAGHSMGGWLALELMRKYSSRVTKLCILASSASLDSAQKTRLRKQLINRLSAISAKEMAERLAALYIYKAEIKPLVIDMFKRNMNDFIPQQQAMLQRISCENVLSEIHVPSTVIVGEHDKEFFNSSKHIADGIVCSRFITLTHCGHMLMLEEPGQCARAMIDWILS